MQDVRRAAADQRELRARQLAADQLARGGACDAANGPPVVVRLVSSTSAALKGTRLRRIGVSVAATRRPFSVTAIAPGCVPGQVDGEDPDRERRVRLFAADTRRGRGTEADRARTPTIRHAAAHAIERSRWGDG